jgi:hypothetical protein
MISIKKAAGHVSPSGFAQGMLRPAGLLLCFDILQ